MTNNTKHGSILVTGSSGYIGAVVVPMLLKQGHTVTGSDTGWFSDIKSNVDFNNMGVDELKTFDVVIHLAGLSDDKLCNAFPDEANKSNFSDTTAFANRCKQAKVKRFILASSAAVYGNTDGAATEEYSTSPETAYSKSKLAAEQALLQERNEHFSVICLRFGSAYGLSPSPREDLVLNRLASIALAQGQIGLATDGLCYRPFLHVQDLAASIVHAANSPEVGIEHAVYNVSHPQGNLRVEQAVEKLAKVTGAKILKAVDKPDPRSYQLDSSRFITTGFSFEWPLEKGLSLLTRQLQCYQSPALPDRVETLATQLSSSCTPSSTQTNSISPSRLTGTAQTLFINDTDTITQQSRYRLAGGFCTEAEQLLKEEYKASDDHQALLMRSGTDALMRALQVLGVNKNSTVAMPEQCFHAVATSVLTLGAKPVFVDVRADDFNLDAAKLEEAFKTQKIDAVITVDNYGTPSDWAAIADVARAHNVPFIIDACESLGATRNQQSALDYADIVVVSFSFTKPIHAAGMGGALIAKQHLTQIIESRESMLYRQIRLPELNAAYLVRAWDQLHTNIDHLRSIYNHYRNTALNNGFTAQQEYGVSTRIHAPFLVPSHWSVSDRDQLVSLLGKQGVMTATQFECQTTLLNLGSPQPVSANIASRVITLPSGGGLAMADVQKAASQFEACIAEIQTAKAPA